MFYIDEDQNITLTRSDSARIELTVYNEAGEAYDFSNDLTQFTVKRNTVTEDIIFQKTFTGGVITIDPSDTKDLYYDDMVYDVQLITPDNDVYTVIDPAKFILGKEVNFNVSRS